MRSPLAVLVVSGLLSACKSPPSQPVTTVTGDTTTIAYHAGDSRLHTLNKVVEYGQVDGPDSTTFADISAFSANGERESEAHVARASARGAGHPPETFFVCREPRLAGWPHLGVACAGQGEGADATTAPPGSPADWWADGKGGAFDVFEADVTYLGSVQQPENMPYAGFPGTIDPIIRGDTVWAITEKENEVQTLSKLVVTPGLAPVWPATVRSATKSPAAGLER